MAMWNPQSIFELGSFVLNFREFLTQTFGKGKKQVGGSQSSTFQTMTEQPYIPGSGRLDEGYWIALEGLAKPETRKRLTLLFKEMKRDLPEEIDIFREVLVNAPAGNPKIVDVPTGKIDKAGKPITEKKIIRMDFTEDDARVKFLDGLGEQIKPDGSNVAEVLEYLRARRLTERDPVAKWFFDHWKPFCAYARRNTLEAFFGNDWEQHELEQIDVKMVNGKLTNWLDRLAVGVPAQGNEPAKPPIIPDGSKMLRKARITALVFGVILTGIVFAAIIVSAVAPHANY